MTSKRPPHEAMVSGRGPRDRQRENTLPGRSYSLTDDLAHVRKLRPALRDEVRSCGPGARIIRAVSAHDGLARVQRIARDLLKGVALGASS
jgi:hypothetical protein